MVSAHDSSELPCAESFMDLSFIRMVRACSPCSFVDCCAATAITKAVAAAIVDVDIVFAALSTNTNLNSIFFVSQKIIDLISLYGLLNSAIRF